MNEEKTREILEGLDIPSDKIDEVLSIMKDQEGHPPKQVDSIGDTVHNSLEEQLNNETDWRRRSSLAAAIISRNLE